MSPYKNLFMCQLSSHHVKRVIDYLKLNFTLCLDMLNGCCFQNISIYLTQATISNSNLNGELQDHRMIALTSTPHFVNFSRLVAPKISDIGVFRNPENANRDPAFFMGFEIQKEATNLSMTQISDDNFSFM